MAKTAKKTARKTVTKAAKKATAKKARANNASRFGENAKIVALIKENPCREETGRYERVQRLLKHSGKKVSDFLAHGGKVATLAFSVDREWVKVVGK